MTGTVFAWYTPPPVEERDFEAELAAAGGSKSKGWANYVLGLGIMLGGLIFMVATNDPESDNLLPIVVGGGATIAGGLIALFGMPSGGDYEKTRRLQYVIDHPELPSGVKNAIADGKIYIGMKEEHLLASWGKPRDINKSVGSWGVHKQYVYGYDVSSFQYVYVEDGEIVSWQS